MPRNAAEIAQLTAGYELGSAEQTRQIAYRLVLADFWGLSQGAQVLEVGCGQGDMTAVLADRVGHLGHVTAIDSGSPDEGAPITLGASMGHLANGPLGKNLSFEFAFQDMDKLAGPYDAVVLAHCSWYFGSAPQLRSTLKQLRSLAPRLFFAEWIPEAPGEGQLGPLLAAQIQVAVSSFQEEPTSNIRTILTRDELGELLSSAGWQIARQTEVPEPAVEDGAWEVANALALEEADLSFLPEDLEQRVRRDLDQLKIIRPPYSSLPSIVLEAVR